MEGHLAIHAQNEPGKVSKTPVSDSFALLNTRVLVVYVALTPDMPVTDLVAWTISSGRVSHLDSNERSFGISVMPTGVQPVCHGDHIKIVHVRRLP
jgi:hypothetical protein